MHQSPAPLTVAVSLRRLFPTASFVGCGDILTMRATDRSQECCAGSLFAVIQGTRQHGAAFVDDALSRGATALLVERPLCNVAVPQCVVPDVRRAYAELAAAIHAFPSRRLGIAGVTGTNGKTTITWLIRSILQAAGRQTGLLGTVEYNDGRLSSRSRLTTPDSGLIAHWLGRMLSAGTTHAAIELSSHALDQRRTAGTLIDVAVLSNITQDHFDYHGNFENYRQSKLRIFHALKPAGLAVVNVDDPGSRSCVDEAPKRLVTYGLEQRADVWASEIEASLFGSRFMLHLGRSKELVQTRLIGRHNISNCLAAAAAAAHLGASLGDVVRGLGALEAVPGRMEAVDGGQPFHVFVDYAHTDDALRRCIGFLQSLCTGRVICVFGAGGDRDRSKRPLLGEAACGADLAVVTSDNPRSERPEEIISEILAGMGRAAVAPHIEPERERAIAWAMRRARPGDCVLIAGKGHETEQVIGSQRVQFDDREVARHALRQLNILPSPHVNWRTTSLAGGEIPAPAGELCGNLAGPSGSETIVSVDAQPGMELVT